MFWFLNYMKEILRAADLNISLSTSLLDDAEDSNRTENIADALLLMTENPQRSQLQTH